MLRTESITSTAKMIRVMRTTIPRKGRALSREPRGFPSPEKTVGYLWVSSQMFCAGLGETSLPCDQPYQPLS